MKNSLEFKNICQNKILVQTNKAFTKNLKIYKFFLKSLIILRSLQLTLLKFGEIKKVKKSFKKFGQKLLQKLGNFKVCITNRSYFI